MLFDDVVMAPTVSSHRIREYPKPFAVALVPPDVAYEYRVSPVLYGMYSIMDPMSPQIVCPAPLSAIHGLEGDWFSTAEPTKTPNI